MIRMLTERELAVLALMGTGRSVPEIARLLHIGAHSVEAHKRGIYAKLQVGNQSHAVSRAVAMGLFEPGTDGAPPPVREPEPGRSILTVVRGAAGPCLDEVTRVLLDHGLPFVHVRAPEPVARDDWGRWHLG